MKRFVPYDKLSKKEKKKIDSAKRGSWGGLDPVTRKPENPRAYNRARARRRIEDLDDSAPSPFSAINTQII